MKSDRLRDHDRSCLRKSHRCLLWGSLHHISLSNSKTALEVLPSSSFWIQLSIPHLPSFPSLFLHSILPFIITFYSSHPRLRSFPPSFRLHFSLFVSLFSFLQFSSLLFPSDRSFCSWLLPVTHMHDFELKAFAAPSSGSVSSPSSVISPFFLTASDGMSFDEHFIKYLSR